MGLISFIKNSDGRKSLKKLDKMAYEVEKLEPKYQAMSNDELRAQTAVFKERLAKGETLDDILYDAFAALREASWRVLGMKHFHVQIVGGICLFQGRIAEMKTGEGKTLVATLPAYLEALSGRGVHIVTVNDYLARRDAEWMGKVHRFMGLTVGVVVPGMPENDKRAAYQADITYGTNNEFGFDYLRDNLTYALKDMVQRELNFAIVDEVDSILIDEARTPLIISHRGQKSSDLYERADKFVCSLHGGYDDELDAAYDAYIADLTAKAEGEGPEAEAAAARLEELANASKSFGRLKPGKSDSSKLDKSEQLGWEYLIERKEREVHLLELGAKKAAQVFNIQVWNDTDSDEDFYQKVWDSNEAAEINHHIQQALKAHHLFNLGEQYIIADEKDEHGGTRKGIIIVDEFTGRLMIGRRYSDGLHQAIEAKHGLGVREENKTVATITFQNYFRLYKKLSGMTGTAKTEEGEFRTIYSLDVIEIPTNMPVARVDLHDRVFSTEVGKKKAIVREIMERHETGQPILVGTVSVEKSEEISRLLRANGVKHNILNAKNHEREAEIVAQAGRFGAVTIATNMAGRGTDILLGGNPEYLAKKQLREEGYEHDAIELATSYAEADEETMKLRKHYSDLYKKFKEQTDAEKKKVIEAGGLCIIGTERHESRRIDNQLRGRSGRQGDVGCSIFFLSLEDDLMKRFGGERMQGIYERSKMEEDESIESKLLTRLIEYAQKQIEGRNFGIRKSVLQYDDVMNQQRMLIYAERMKVLRGEDVHDQILKYIPDLVEDRVRYTVEGDNVPAKWNEADLNAELERGYLPDGTNFVTREKLERWEFADAISEISAKITEVYEARIAEQDEDCVAMTGMTFHALERYVLLRFVTDEWVDHIDAMDRLRKSIHLRSYAQRDPIIDYKQEGSALFEEMIERIQNRTITYLLRFRPQVRRPEPVRIYPNAAQPAEQGGQHPMTRIYPNAAPVQASGAPDVRIAEAEASSLPSRTAAPAGQKQPEAALPQGIDRRQLVTSGSEKFNPASMKKQKKPGANDPCWCGSGLKYKKCHMMSDIENNR